MEAGEAEVREPARRLVRWNEYDGRWFTFRFRGAALFEVANSSQDENSR
jgi:hypothetical protein